MRRGDLVNQKFYSSTELQESNLPIDLGSQGVGVVEEIGPDVTDVAIGDRVVCTGSNTYASYNTFSANRLIPIPSSISMEDAAAGFLQGFLAWAFTHKAYPVQPEDWCLVQAAAGGLGLLICQMIKLRQGKVVGVTSSEKKAEFVRETGEADEVIISSQTDILKAVRHITEGKGVNAVYDGVGKDTFETNLDALTLGGYLIMYGQASGYVPPVRSDEAARERVYFSNTYQWFALYEALDGIST
ncbi:zinc-binding dehydrogenase [Virgibacillus halophilus]|uniref:Zinc-binding dehydrogenase n=1 Tax=Tigheibacillus halophilus TaxID=361280 RepID=A0ABU5C8P1_9BACI|nr:zinc-binding dehydrogenase [Virgibacillus halophilus]